MSHFCGLVILTPDYEKNHDLYESLEKYSENRKVPEYSEGEVSDFEKEQFIEYHTLSEAEREKLNEDFSDVHKGEDGYMSFEQYMEERNDDSERRYRYMLMYDHKQEYADYFKEKHPELFAKFGELYKEHGNSWNGDKWRINHLTGKLEEYSTYNPDSKWDWYDEHGRWSGCIKTKSGEFVDECLLGEIDWSDFKPEDYEDKEKEYWDGTKYKPLKDDVKYHYTQSEPPFCLVVDGEWIERGRMGWWAIVTDEKGKEDWAAEFAAIIQKLPEDSKVYNIDFHI